MKTPVFSYGHASRRFAWTSTYRSSGVCLPRGKRRTYVRTCMYASLGSVWKYISDQNAALYIYLETDARTPTHTCITLSLVRYVHLHHRQEHNLYSRTHVCWHPQHSKVCRFGLSDPPQISSAVISPIPLLRLSTAPIVGRQPLRTHTYLVFLEHTASRPSNRSPLFTDEGSVGHPRRRAIQPRTKT